MLNRYNLYHLRLSSMAQSFYKWCEKCNGKWILDKGCSIAKKWIYLHISNSASFNCFSDIIDLQHNIHLRFYKYKLE